MKWLRNIQNYLDQTIRNNTGVSSLSFIMVAIGITAVLLLLVICVCMLIEVIYNHTISTSLEGYAAIIGAVAGLITSVGLPKAINNYSENKFRPHNNVE
jgi:hypothetical protein